MARRRARRLLVEPHGRETVAAEVVAGDWAVANAGAAAPDPGRRARLAGQPQYAPARLVGRIDGRLDATGIVLDFVPGVAA